VTAQDWRGTFLAVARADDVRPGPVAVRVLDAAVVLFRDHTGRVGALEDRCPHRQVPLSSGSVGFFGELLCGYHGWAFEADGRCARMPSSHATMPLRLASVRAYDVRELDGLVWVALDRPDAEPAGAAAGATHGLRPDRALLNAATAR